MMMMEELRRFQIFSAERSSRATSAGIRICGGLIAALIGIIKVTGSKEMKVN